MRWVSWFGAMAYTKWMGNSLPNEAMWEYAARCCLYEPVPLNDCHCEDGVGDKAWYMENSQGNRHDLGSK